VKVRLGTLDNEFDDPDLNLSTEDTVPHNYNVILGHLWGNFSWVFSPRMGNLGPAVFQQFELIIDYKLRRVVLIRLDSAGHRRVEVPAYASRWTTPIKPVPVPVLKSMHALGIQVTPGNFLDTVNTANNTRLQILDTGAPGSRNGVLGYDFLSNLGVFGINQRTHEFILYH
jgi:hypothetical protein